MLVTNLNQAYVLTEEERNTFLRDGFIGPFDPFLPEGALDELHDYCEDIEVNKKKHPLYKRFSSRDWHLVSPKLLDLFTHPAVVQRLRQLMGDDLVLWRSKIFHKSPGEGRVGWHQEWGLFNGEEIGNDKPSLIFANPGDAWWNITMWIALNDIPLENGPLQFMSGSHQTRYPYHMVPMTESAFFHDPFVGVSDPKIIIERAQKSELVLDIDTKNLFDGVDPYRFSMAEMKAYVFDKLSQKMAKVTPFEPDPDRLVTLPMKKGQFVIFTERTMHGSLPNTSDKNRVAINCRVTFTDTLIYPGRLQGDYVDGSNIDISAHRCVLLSGEDKNGQNVY